MCGEVFVALVTGCLLDLSRLVRAHERGYEGSLCPGGLLQGLGFACKGSL
jgi:hypothetical protein